MSENSVTNWLNQLKEGDADAAQHLWERYFETLVQLARKKMGARYRRVADEEDVALSAFRSFFRNATEGRFPQLNDRDDLWRLLITLTERKIFGHIKHQKRQKRGAGNVRGDSIWARPGAWDKSSAQDEIVCPEPSPAFAAQVAEEVEKRLDGLPEDVLREIALLKMEGLTNDEVAEKLTISKSTVKRKIQVIRTLWDEEET